MKIYDVYVFREVGYEEVNWVGSITYPAGQ